MFASGWKRLSADRKAAALLALLLLTGAVMGLCGLGAGIPGPERLNVLPGGAPLTAAQAEGMAEKWRSLYKKIKVSHADLSSEEPVTYAVSRVVFKPGWKTIPNLLIDSCRSFLLQSLDPDEKKAFIILAQMRPWKLKFEPLYIQYGGAFVYPLGAALAAAAAAHAAVLTGDVAHYLQHPADMGRLYLIGRLYVLVFALGLMAALFFIGREISGAWTGFWAAALFALTPLSVGNTHLVKPHAVGAFWALACAFFLVRACARGKLADYTWGGVCAGLAAGACLTLGVCGFWPFAAWLTRRFEGKSKKNEWRRAAGAAGMAAAVCAAFNPYLVFSFRDFWWEMEIYPRGAAAAQGLGLGREVLNFWGGAAQSLGIVLAALAALGLAVGALRRGPRRFLSLAAIFSAAVIWIKLGNWNEFRLYYPMAAVGVLLAVDFILALPRWVAAACLCLALLDTGARGGAQLANIVRGGTRRATRIEAADWIQAHVPEKSALGLLRYPEPAHTPPLRFNRYRLVVLPRREDWASRRAPAFAVVDADGLEQIEAWGLRGYVVAAQFLPESAPWAGSERDPAYFDTGFYVLEKRPYLSRQ
ncbi:MAG TPA: hypothetical protein VNH15_03605 [Elusimicrobiota bacterium]|nr:hypothetical protein [Elusimicrobiota bacterium]